MANKTTESFPHLYNDQRGKGLEFKTTDNTALYSGMSKSGFVVGAQTGNWSYQAGLGEGNNLEAGIGYSTKYSTSNNGCKLI